MKIFLPWMIAITILLSGCSGVPSEQTIQTAIAETQLAQITITPVYTATPVYTSTPAISSTLVDLRKQVIDKSVSLLNQKKYEDVGQLFQSEWGEKRNKFRDDEELNTLLDYANNMAYVTTINFAPDPTFADISPDYDGIYHQTISSTILSYISRDEWVRRYKERTDILATYHATQTVVALTPVPMIGMTAEEVRNSQWGAPDEINRTTTANSVTEQWVYGNGRYLYFEDGILTAIQE